MQPPDLYRPYSIHAPQLLVSVKSISSFMQSFSKLTGAFAFHFLSKPCVFFLLPFSCSLYSYYLSSLSLPPEQFCMHQGHGPHHSPPEGISISQVPLCSYWVSSFGDTSLIIIAAHARFPLSERFFFFFLIYLERQSTSRGSSNGRGRSRHSTEQGSHVGLNPKTLGR